MDSYSPHTTLLAASIAAARPVPSSPLLAASTLTTRSVAPARLLAARLAAPTPALIWWWALQGTARSAPVGCVTPRSTSALLYAVVESLRPAYGY